MVGRDLELQVGRRFLKSLEDGSACLVVEGEPGIGKTTVWRETVAAAEGLNYRVLACRPAESEAKLSYAGLGDLLAGVERAVLQDLPAPQRLALEVALLQAAPGHAAPKPRALFSAVSSVLSQLALAGPLLVAVDDLQWLDRPSAGAVEFALRRLGDRTVGLLASERVAPQVALSPGLSRALEEAGAQRLVLGPLSVAALHALISARLDRHFPRPVMVRIATASRGNPFYALEIARELCRRGELSPGEALPLPPDLSELVSARIRRLPPATREALLAAAALRDPQLKLLDRAALDQAEKAGLVLLTGDRVEFLHPLFASAVYSSAGAHRRRRLHKRLAAALADPEERARHFALAAAGPSEDIAAALEKAAGHARSRGAPDGAAELFELAVVLTPSGRAHSRRSRTIAAAENCVHAGDLGRARALAEEALGGSPPGPERGNALRVLGEIRYQLDSFAEAIPLFEEALVQLDGDCRRVEVRVDLTFVHIGHGSLKAAADHARAAVQEASSAGDRGLYALALGASAIADFLLGRPLDRDRLELALGHEDPDRQTSMSIRPSLVAANVLSLSDDFDRARLLLEALRQRTLDRGEDSDLPMVCSQLSYIERQRGSLDRALSFAEEGLQIGRTVGSHTAQALMLSERCFVRATLGDIQGARADAREAQRFLGQVEYRLAHFWRRWALAFLELSLGNATEASTLLEPLVTAVESRGHFYPQAALTLPDTIEALAAVGQVDRAERLSTLLEEYGHAHALNSAAGIAARCLALVMAARGDLTAAQVIAERALSHHERVGMPLELGRSLLVKGQIERRAKRKRGARESLERAIGLFDQVGARLWADKARVELSRSGFRRPGPDDLTPTELQVAQLATRGLTMKRIAEAAFLSPKTVEANLTRIYGKLGIHSRAELGRVMAERERAAPK